MLPSSIMTFMSFTQQPSTPLSVLVARATASFMASSKPSSEMALSSVTLAMLMRLCLPKPSLAAYPKACATFTAPDSWRRPSCPWLYPCAGPSVLPSSFRYLRLENHRLLHAALGLVYSPFGPVLAALLGHANPPKVAASRCRSRHSRSSVFVGDLRNDKKRILCYSTLSVDESSLDPAIQVQHRHVYRVPGNSRTATGIRYARLCCRVPQAQDQTTQRRCPHPPQTGREARTTRNAPPLAERPPKRHHVR